MIERALQGYVERELKYQARREISKKIRENCPEGSDPMVTGITVALGTVLAMAVFSAMLARSGGGRTR